MVQIIANLSERAHRKLRIYMAYHNLSNKRKAINLYIEDSQLYEEESK